MKKLMCILAVLFAFVVFCTAYASENMINPYFQEANNPPPIASPFSLRASNKVTVDVTILNQPSLVQNTVFEAKASGGDGNYQYCFYILDPTDTSEEYPTGNPHGFRSQSSSGIYSYRFVVPGTYTVLAYAKDGSDSYWDAINTVTFNIEDSTAMTSQKKVDELVAKCIAAGCKTDYDKALWFHDWLIENAYYDLTYSYYSADGVLIRGCGVCDSYSKAYVMLLEAVGIETQRVTNVDHAWNLVKLDGEWYHIDSTWDDPVSAGYETAKLSGSEYHMYFGLPDEIMRLDRSFEAYSSDIIATGIEYNYYLKSGKINIWTDPLVVQVSDSLTKSGYAFELTPPSYYKLENGRYTRGKEPVVYKLSAYAMDRMSWNHGGLSIPVNFEYDAGKTVFSGEIIFRERTLSLPGALTEVQAEAFKGGGNYLSVDLPDGVSSIGEAAFANSPNLWKITIPSSVTDISADAFSGSDNVTIVCSSGSAAEKYAKDHDIKCRTE